MPNQESFASQFELGLRSSLRSCRSLTGHKWVLLVIVLFALLFMAGSTFLGGWLGVAASRWMSQLFGGFSWSESLPGWVLSALEWLTGAVVWLSTVLLMSLVGGCVLLLALSPLLSHVSDMGWKSAGQSLPRDTPATLARSVCRGMLVALRNTLLQAALLLVTLVVGFFPVVGFVAPALALGINAYFYGASLADYALDRAGLSARQSVSYALRHRGLMVGLGLPFALLMLVPFVGKYAALFMAPAVANASGVVLATARREEGQTEGGADKRGS